MFNTANPERLEGLFKHLINSRIWTLTFTCRSRCWSVFMWNTKINLIQKTDGYQFQRTEKHLCERQEISVAGNMFCFPTSFSCVLILLSLLKACKYLFTNEQKTYKTTCRKVMTLYRENALTPLKHQYHGNNKRSVVLCYYTGGKIMRETVAHCPVLNGILSKMMNIHLFLLHLGNDRKRVGCQHGEPRHAY